MIERSSRVRSGPRLDARPRPTQDWTSADPPRRSRLEAALVVALIVSLAVPLPWDLTPGGPTVFAFSLPLLALIAVWALSSPGQPRTREATRGPDPVLVTMGLLILATAASNVVTAANSVATTAPWRWTSLWVWLALLYAFARYRAPRVLGPSGVRAALHAVVLVVLAISVVQFATDSAWGAVAQYFPGGTVQDTQVWNVGEGLKRVQGPFFATNILGMWLTVVVLFIFAFQLERPTWAGRVALAGSTVVLLLTFSRGIWLIAPLAILILLIGAIRTGVARLNHAVLAGLCAVALVAAVVMFAPAAWTARFEADQGSTAARTTATDAGLVVVERASLSGVMFGVGYGQFVAQAERLGVYTPLRPHNIYLQVLAEQGVIVLVAFVAVILALLGSPGQRLVPGRSVLIVACGASMLAWMTFMLIYETANEYAFLPVLVFLVGYGRARGEQQKYEPSDVLPLRVDPW